MKKEKIYIIKNLYRRINNAQWNIDNISFRDMDKAIEYCNSKLTEEEKEKMENIKKRKLANWYEFFSKDYIYEIKEIDLI